MVSQLVLSMELRLVNKQGFTTLELLLVLFVVTISVVLGSVVVPTIELNQFKNEYLLTQLQAMSQSKRIELNSEFDSNVSRLSFNAFGHVNQAQTIIARNKQYTVQLGMGRILDE